MILDAGVFILAEQRPGRLAALLERLDIDTMFATNHNALAQVWRSPARQVRLRRFLTEYEIAVEPVNDSEAIGTLLARAGTSDVVDASLALMALSDSDVVLTSDPGDLTKLGASAIAI